MMSPKICLTNRAVICWAIGLLSVLVFFPNLGGTLLWDEDEGFYASTAREMYVANEWIVPHFNGELFGHKPPWMYWMMMIGYSIFGVGEWGARFFSAVFSVLTVFLTFRMGETLLSRRTGAMAAIILATSMMFTVVGRSATPDSFLVFFTTFSVYMFVGQMWIGRRIGMIRLAMMYASLGLATLVKGPIGFLFPMTVIGGFLVWKNAAASQPLEHVTKAGCFQRLFSAATQFRPSHFVEAFKTMRPIFGLAVILLVAGPWYLWVGLKTDGQFLREFFGVHHFQRATSAMEGHYGSVFYYPVSILVGMFPWTVATLPVWLLWCKPAQLPAHREAKALVSIWVIVYLVVFSLAATKLPNYILPCYPALALMFAWSFDRWLSESQSYAIIWPRGALVTLMLVGMGLIFIFPVMARWPVGGETLLDRLGAAKNLQQQIQWLGLLGVPAVIGGMAGWWFLNRNQFNKAWIALGAAAVLTVLGLWNLAAPWLTQFQGTQKLIARLRTESTDSRFQLATFDFFRPTMVFYNEAPVLRFYEPSQAVQFLSQSDDHSDGQNGGAVLVLEASRLDELSLPAGFQFVVVDRCSRFPEKGELVAIKLRPEVSEANSEPANLFRNRLRSDGTFSRKPKPTTIRLKQTRRVG